MTATIWDLLNDYCARMQERNPKYGRALNFARTKIHSESPLEHVFLAAWVERHARLADDRTGAITYAGERFPWADAPEAKFVRINLRSQIQIGRYRVDFLVSVEAEGMRDVRFVIECDGHNFHERSAKQASHDRARDRKLLREGYVTLRYTYDDLMSSTGDSIRDLWETMAAYTKAFQHSKKEQSE